MLEKSFFNTKNINTWSAIGSRATYGLAMYEIAKKRDDIIVLTADVSTSAGLDRYRRDFPNKYLDIGIAEQNMIGVAAGLASENLHVFTTTFAPFQTARCLEQIKVNLGYMKQKVCMTGLASGLVLGTLGYTHCSIEDVGVLRSIPNISIVSPADSFETVKVLNSFFDYNQSIYIRLTGGSPNPKIYNEDYEFKIGKGIILSQGEDITIISCGSSIKIALDVVNELKNQNKLNAKLINMHTIKPIDLEILNEINDKTKLVVTIEEHNIIGGLGSAVSEALSQINKKIKQITIGHPDSYGKGGEYKFLLNKYGFSKESIISTIFKNL